MVICSQASLEKVLTSDHVDSLIKRGNKGKVIYKQPKLCLAVLFFFFFFFYFKVGQINFVNCGCNHILLNKIYKFDFLH